MSAKSSEPEVRVIKLDRRMRHPVEVLRDPPRFCPQAPPGTVEEHPPPSDEPRKCGP